MQSDRPPPAFVLRSCNRWTGHRGPPSLCARIKPQKTQASGTKLLGFDLNNQSRGMGTDSAFHGVPTACACETIHTSFGPRSLTL
jgi:hypothetical protein